MPLAFESKSFYQISLLQKFKNLTSKHSAANTDKKKFWPNMNGLKSQRHEASLQGELVAIFGAVVVPLPPVGVSVN